MPGISICSLIPIERFPLLSMEDLLKEFDLAKNILFKNQLHFVFLKLP
jgi:hypothetical protein